MELYNTLKQNNLTFVATPTTGASYIFKDGKFLDLNSSKEIIYAPECVERNIISHIHVEDYLFRNELIPEFKRKSLVKTDNVIAINDGTNYIPEAAYIVLPENAPTTKQYTALLSWLDYVMTLSDTIQIEDPNKNVVCLFDFVSPTNENGYTSEQIIKEIKKMYI